MIKQCQITSLHVWLCETDQEEPGKPSAPLSFVPFGSRLGFSTPLASMTPPMWDRAIQIHANQVILIIRLACLMSLDMMMMSLTQTVSHPARVHWMTAWELFSSSDTALAQSHGASWIARFTVVRCDGREDEAEVGITSAKSVSRFFWV